MKVEIRGDNYDAPEYKEYQKELDDYYEAKAKAEEIAMPFHQTKPEMNDRIYMWKEGYISNKMLQEDYRYSVINDDPKEGRTLSICFYDGLAMVVRPTEELLKKLEEL